MIGPGVPQLAVTAPGASTTPPEFLESWGSPSPFFRRPIRTLTNAMWLVIGEYELIDGTNEFADLVNAVDTASLPVHRWFSYKEAFSPRLPRRLLAQYGAGKSHAVADVFGGVATTALSLLSAPGVERIISVEYSPLSVFVGSTKITWPYLSPDGLRELIDIALAFKSVEVSRPGLSSFANTDVFDPAELQTLLSARQHIRSLEIDAALCNFLLLGLAAVIEDISGTMKDGRALRIVRGRTRKPLALSPRRGVPSCDDRVKDALARQWAAMIEDIDDLSPARPSTQGNRAFHLKGDARYLTEVRVEGEEMLPSGSIGLCISSPPYLNCIDYSEVYKLENWFLGFVKNQAEFRALRLGTLRSHPSIDFPRRGYLDEIATEPVTLLLNEIAEFVERHGARRQTGRMIYNYFDDIFKVLMEQYRVLEPGGHAILVVGNSTFSRRVPGCDGERIEQWRVPVPTDLLLAKFAEHIGFDVLNVVKARDLRPRNVSGGVARESLVALRKPEF